MLSILPLNKTKTKVEGLLNVEEEWYRIHIDKTCENPKITCDWRLRHKLLKHLSLLEQRLKQCNDISQFLSEVKLLLESSQSYTKKSTFRVKCFDKILLHLQELGWENVKSVSDDFLNVKLKTLDSSEREHILNVTLDTNYPQSAPKLSCILPIPFESMWTADSDFNILHNQFKMFLKPFERLWDDVEELNQHCWILEPESPNYAATSFRIALSKTSSIQINVDPFNVGAVPECNFLGAEWAISPLREKFQEKYEEWNENLSLYQNLKRICEIDFPQKQFTNSEDLSMQCGICYAFRLGSSVPDQICHDKRCGQPFHHECLLEWMRSIPGSKQSFNVIFGECPYCTNAMKLDLVRT